MFSKHLEKVWHGGLLFKLKAHSDKDDLLLLLINSLQNRKQRVLLNDKTSEWRKISSRVTEGSVLGPLLFSDLHKLST